MLWAPGCSVRTLGSVTWPSALRFQLAWQAEGHCGTGSARGLSAVARHCRAMPAPDQPGSGRGRQGGARGRGASPAGQREGFLEEGGQLLQEQARQWRRAAGWGGLRLAGFLGCSHFIQMQRSVKHLGVVRPRPLSVGAGVGGRPPRGLLGSCSRQGVWPRLGGQQAASGSIWEAEGTGLGAWPWEARGFGLGGWVGSRARGMGGFGFSPSASSFVGGAGVAEVSLSCAASVWLWGRYNAGLKGELAAVSLAPFARVGL